MEPSEVLPTLAGHLLVDGFDLVLDLDASRGCRIVDARDGTAHLDMFGFFASSALGMNHPALYTGAVERRLLRAARHKPTLSDVYAAGQAEFVATFERLAADPALPRLFLIEGGALAVENALKAAFDWKSRHNEARGRDPALGTRVLHLRRAFHGRTGYTMSLTNTAPVKTARYPAFDWPRIPAPALPFPRDPDPGAREAREDEALEAAAAAFEAHPHDIACFVAEPIQGEGGDRHLSARFLGAIQRLCRVHDALVVLDEIQTGVGLTGTTWCYEQLDLEPDLVAFGKKTHVCGAMGGRRVEEVEDHVFVTSDRLNSTFGGGLVDMVRATTVLEVIDRDGLVPRAAEMGAVLLDHLRGLEDRQAAVTAARGRGLMCAFDLPDTATRDRVLAHAFAEHRVMVSGCGPRTVRFRPPLVVSADELEEAVGAIEDSVHAVA